MTLRLRAKVLLHVWSYDFYDTTLSIEYHWRHMINVFLQMRLQIRWALCSIEEQGKVGEEQEQIDLSDNLTRAALHVFNNTQSL